MKLLIADDDITSRMILSSMTEEWGYEPLCAEDGEEAWELLQQEGAPDLILLDWEMPRLNGLGLCLRIREQITENPPYIIMLTAHDNIDDVVKGLENGANDYIAKPYNSMELQARLNVGKRMLNLQIELQAAKERLELLASHDELTGIHNRRSFNERFHAEWLRARRHKEVLSVAILDIDHFKKFNDAYGHLPGDVCLRSVAQELERTLKRPMDFLARYGGEEFAIILPQTSDPVTILEACRIAIERLAMEHRDSSHGVVTVSIGAASVVPSIDFGGPNYLLNCADDELYKAKEQGRNRVATMDLTQKV